MASQLSFSFSSELYNDMEYYLLFVSPDKRITAKANKTKQTTYVICNGQGTYTPLHFTVADFSATRGLGPSLVQALREVCSKYQPFIIHLQDYGGFDCRDNSTFFIKIENHQPLLNLAKDLRTLNPILKEGGCKMAKFVSHPHLTVVRGLSQLNYSTTMIFYKDKTFRDSFIVSHLKLIKKKILDRQSQTVATIPLSYPII